RSARPSKGRSNSSGPTYEPRWSTQRPWLDGSRGRHPGARPARCDDDGGGVRPVRRHPWPGRSGRARRRARGIARARRSQRHTGRPGHRRRHRARLDSLPAGSVAGPSRAAAVRTGRDHHGDAHLRGVVPRPRRDRASGQPAGQRDELGAAGPPAEDRMRRLRADSERGSMSALVVVLFVFLMILAGLVVDGGNAINARQRAIDDAEQAARVAANQIDMTQLRANGQVTIVWPDADTAARAYLGQRGYQPGNVQVFPAADGGVTVTVESTVSTQLLSLAFIPSFTVTG